MIREEVNLTANVESGKIDINDSAVRDTVNSMLDGITAHCFITPYIALERVSKVLANFHIFLPKYTFMEGDSGLATFPVNQFGEKMGMTNDGHVVTTPSSPFTLWFEYQLNDTGKYDVFCMIVNQDEFHDLVNDLDDDMDDDDDLSEAVVLPETGPRKMPGASCDVAHETEEDDQTSPSMSDLIKSIVRRTMKPGIKFAGDEAGSKQKPSTSLAESKKKSLTEAPFQRVTTPVATAYSPQSRVNPLNKIEGGPLDTKDRPINTLQNFVKTGAPVTAAVDKTSPYYGKTGTIDTGQKGLSFTQQDPSYPGDPESKTPPGQVQTTVYGKVPISATDTGSDFTGKGSSRIDIPYNIDRPQKEISSQGYSQQPVNITWDDKSRVASMDEDAAAEFRKTHGSNYNPNSPLDRAKMAKMQSNVPLPKPRPSDDLTGTTAPVTPVEKGNLPDLEKPVEKSAEKPVSGDTPGKRLIDKGIDWFLKSRQTQTPEPKQNDDILKGSRHDAGTSDFGFQPSPTERVKQSFKDLTNENMNRYVDIMRKTRV